MNIKQYLFSLIMLVALHPVLASDRFANVKLESQLLRDNVHMITGAGGNIGVSAGRDGVLMIDDQFAPLAGKIKQKLAAIGNGQLKYIINTHHHGDHTGANGALNHDNSITIVAHHNVRSRLVSQDVQHNHLPVLTFDASVRYHFNDDIIDVIHMPSGHTDGDSVVYFKKANVLHAGDHFFNQRFPFIDLSSGGSVKGYLNNVNTLIDLIDDNTIIIPGHGILANKADMIGFRDMIRSTLVIVKDGKASGLSLDAVIEKGLGAEWKKWHWSFISEQRWIKTLY